MNEASQRGRIRFFLSFFLSFFSIEEVSWQRERNDVTLLKENVVSLKRGNQINSITRIGTILEKHARTLHSRVNKKLYTRGHISKCVHARTHARTHTHMGTNTNSLHYSLIVNTY